MMKNLVILLIFILTTGASFARDNLYFAGSSTVFPFITKTVEEYVQKHKGQSPVIESLGTGGGFKVFCAGMTQKFPDVAMASRPIKETERELCNKNNVSNIIELPFGFDGIVLVNNIKQPIMNISIDEFYRAIAATVPDANGEPIKNPNKNWSDINKKFPNNPIIIYGPPASSGTRDALVELVITHTAQGYFGKNPKVNADNLKLYTTIVREDGVYIDAGENDSLIVNKLDNQPLSFGILGYNHYYLNEKKVNAAVINNSAPSSDTIQSKKYPLARLLYLYAKADNLKTDKNLQGFLTEFFSEKNISSNGELADKGLVAMDKASRDKVRDQLKGK